ncbi:nucleotide exchange factor GrpE [Calidithermus timidus]|jgi:molecular chaperone GrpE|uniref:nucleotide exchange factor GrpE n=1 Tax=Calidithermus timidus TaxID=307124 RepID=UPI0003695A50|nr:nucleotide exchange factor GrpE [Calidithermus timidus]
MEETKNTQSVEAAAETPVGETQPNIPEVERLRAELEVLQAELQAAKDKYIRLYADFDNFRKRSATDLEDARKSGELRVLRALLPISDDLERALGFAQAKPEDLIPGVKAVLENFKRTLTSLGVEPVPGVGSDFDPRYHEAIGMLEGEKDKVLHLYQEGYRYGEMLVRPARVVVGNGAGQEEPKADGS